MNKTNPIKVTGPLSPADLGQFTYRDGIWYLNPIKSKPVKA